MVLQIYTRCWANAANSSHRESSAHLLTMNICSLQHIWTSCALSSPSLFQPLEHWQQWLSFNLHPCQKTKKFYFSKNLHRTLWSPTWFECQRDGTVIREQQRFDQQSYTQKSGFLINWVKVQTLFYVLFTFAHVKRHHLCSGRPLMLIEFIKFSLCFDRERDLWNSLCIFSW